MLWRKGTLAIPNYARTYLGKLRNDRRILLGQFVFLGYFCAHWSKCRGIHCDMKEKRTKKKRNVRPVRSQQPYHNENELPGTEFASSKLAQVSTTRNSPLKLSRSILAAKWRLKFCVTGYKFWNWYDLRNTISFADSRKCSENDPIASEPSYECSRILDRLEFTAVGAEKKCGLSNVVSLFMWDLKSHCPRRQVYYSIVFANFWFPRKRKIQVLPLASCSGSHENNSVSGFPSAYLSIRRRFSSSSGCITSK